MKKSFFKAMVTILAISMLLTSFSTAVFAATSEGDGSLEVVNSYSTGYSDQDGGVAEIIAYNKDNQKAYLVNGRERTIDILKYDEAEKSFVLDQRVDLSEMIEGFTFGDVTSVDVDTNFQRIAVAVQAEDYAANGAILILDYDGKYVTHFECGVQPDFVMFSQDGSMVLTADEGEPREGFGEGIVDPIGSVTIVKLEEEGQPVTTVNFEEWDAKRDELLAKNILLKKDLKPSEDFEPEYIAMTASPREIYVSLQEANAIATLDLESMSFTSIDSLGFKDHREEENALDAIKDKEIKIETQNLMGARMADAIAVVEVEGKTYLFTANEGDASEWGEGDNEYTNMTTIEAGKDAEGEAIEIEVLDKEKMEGLPEEEVDFLIGGRSFTVYEKTEEGLELVYDSGKDFEEITAKLFPENFNASHKNNKLDNRSDAKGPEPEDVSIYETEDSVYVFVALERICGVMFYEFDKANMSEGKFRAYVNNRDFSVDFPEEGADPASGDLGPEWIEIIPAEDSPTGECMLLVSNEVSGTVTLINVLAK